jgi:hypothetical protein
MEVRTRLFLGRLRSKPIRSALALAMAAALLGFGFAVEWPSLIDILRAIRSLAQQQKDANETTPVWTLLGGLTAPFGLGLGALLLLAGFRDRLKSAGLDPGKMVAAARKSVRWRDLGVQLGFRARFDEALQEVTRALGRRTLTILIDDLDRCQPPQIAEVLEEVNYLAGCGGCFIVLAIAKEQVLAGVGLAHADIAKELYPDLDERGARDTHAKDFLRKLIQIEVPMPKFDAAAAERLFGAATASEQTARPDRSWVAGVTAVALCAVLFGAGTLGHSLYAPLEWKLAAPRVETTEALEPFPSPVVSPNPLPNPAPPPPSPLPTPPLTLSTTAGAYELGHPALPSKLWLLLLIPVVGGAGLAMLLHARRPNDDADVDTPEFARALDHWAGAAWLASGSPREMKRFLNHLRFAAAAPGAALPGGVLVGLGVLTLADADAVHEFAEAGGDWATEIGTRVKDRSLWNAITEAADQDKLRRSELPGFTPRQQDATRFLELWGGVRVRA